MNEKQELLKHCDHPASHFPVREYFPSTGTGPVPHRWSRSRLNTIGSEVAGREYRLVCSRLGAGEHGAAPARGAERGRPGGLRG